VDELVRGHENFADQFHDPSNRIVAWQIIDESDGHQVRYGTVTY
jgi:hypothetical protein